MICETKATKGSAKSMQYQANDKGFAVEVARNGLIGDNPKEWHSQMRAIEKQYDRANFENKRITQVISLTKEESKEMKSGKDWEDLAKKHFEKKGVDLKNHAYIMHTHGSTQNPHLHVTVSRVTFSGKQGIKDNRIGEEFGKITNQIAKERGWNTAQETAELKRKEVGKNINDVLQKEKVTDFESFKTAMGERGYNIKLAESEAKGTYGMRIIPQKEYTETPSPRLAKSGQGYKLSEIEKTEGTKAKFKITDIKAEFRKNKIALDREKFMSLNKEEKIKYHEEKMNRVFGTEPKTEQNREQEKQKIETLQNLDKAIEKIEPYKNANLQTYESVKAVREAVKTNEIDNTEDLKRANQIAKTHISHIEAIEKKQEQEKPKSEEKKYSDFDQMKQKREVKQEQNLEKEEEKKRGFRR